MLGTLNLSLTLMCERECEVGIIMKHILSSSVILFDDLNKSISYERLLVYVIW